MKVTSQSDYTKRIERVIAAVAESLQQEQALPSVASLAEIASFSPFHFMRVYRALAGESLGTTVQRLRLARAAHLLAASQASISEIAGRVGFETSQAFARAFRQHFGMPPSRARHADVARAPRTTTFKAPLPQPAIRVDVVELEPFRAAVMRTRGEYTKLDEVYRALFAWMAERGALESIDGIWGVPRQDRRDWPEQDYPFDCCLATAVQLQAGDGVTIEAFGGGNYLQFLHAGSFERLEESLDALILELLDRPAWMLRDAPILQEYLNDPEATAQADLRTNIYLPVRESAGADS